MHNEPLPMPHAIILQRLTGLGWRKFTDIVESLRAQGIDPPFLRDPRVVQAALDDLVTMRLVARGAPAPTPQEQAYIRVNDPSPEQKDDPA